MNLSAKVLVAIVASLVSTQISMNLNAAPQEIDEEVVGIQFFYDDDISVEKFIRNNRITIGVCDFADVVDEDPTLEIHNTAHNYDDTLAFIEEFKVQIPDNWPGAAKGMGTIVLRMNDDGETFVAVGFETSEPSNDELFMLLSEERIGQLRSEVLFNSETYRYNKLVSWLVGNLATTDRYTDSHRLLGVLKKDAQVETEGIVELLEGDNPSAISGAILGLYVLGEKKLLKAYSEMASPICVQQISAESYAEREKALLALHCLGPLARSSTEKMVEAVQRYIRKRDNEQFAQDEIKYTVELMIITLTAIESESPRVRDLLQQLEEHPVDAVRAAARNAIKESKRDSLPISDPPQT